MIVLSEVLPTAADRYRREFSPTLFEAWLEWLCAQGCCALLVGLLGKLERLVQAPLDGPRRLAIMRSLLPVIEDLADDLPTNPPSAAVPVGRPEPLTLAQRLAAATYTNLRRTLEALDQGGAGLLGEHAEGRLWLVSRMFDCLGRQIALAARRGPSWPPHTWQELHDLSAYCANRLQAGKSGVLDHGGPGAPDDLSFDALTAYKRLLMIGLCAEEGAGTLLLSDAAEHFETWVQASELRDPAACFGGVDACLVDPSEDAPARRQSGALGVLPQTRALILPPAFLAALAAAKGGLGEAAAH